MHDQNHCNGDHEIIEGTYQIGDNWSYETYYTWAYDRKSDGSSQC